MLLRIVPRSRAALKLGASELSTLETGSKSWAGAEKAADEIISRVQPTSVSEERRRDVTDYIKRLIKNSLGAEVIAYGSVPLKTYLPGGDIDLTVFGGASAEDALAAVVKSILDEEATSNTSEFVVKNVQLIGAEVKVVRCMVQNIVVDVSFNQIGGLCSLCFIEQVDRLIDKDHLFKRSIILIKSWCYYESRTHGAHHGLISTYALEILVLFIILFFHSKLNGPLAVLYKFLDYFGKFDWETYGISLNGPFCLSALPTILGEMREGCDENSLLSHDVLNSCLDMFSVPSIHNDKNSRGFQRKHLNIVDPLKVVNNLGRSVSKGNFYRICNAFNYGATKLTSVLLQPDYSIASELHKFFSNTIAKNGNSCNTSITTVPRPEYNFPTREFTANFYGDFRSSSLLDLTGDLESYFHCLRYARWCIDSGFGLPMHSVNMTSSPSTSYQSNNQWDGHFPPRFMRNDFFHQYYNGFHPNPTLYPLQPMLIPEAPMGWGDIPMSRGTGNTNGVGEGYRSGRRRRNRARSNVRDRSSTEP